MVVYLHLDGSAAGGAGAWARRMTSDSPDMHFLVPTRGESFLRRRERAFLNSRARVEGGAVMKGILLHHPSSRS